MAFERKCELVKAAKLSKVTDELHALREWIHVYEREYHLPKEVVREVDRRCARMAKKVAAL